MRAADIVEGKDDPRLRVGPRRAAQKCSKIVLIYIHKTLYIICQVGFEIGRVVWGNLMIINDANKRKPNCSLDPVPEAVDSENVKNSCDASFYCIQTHVF